MKYFKIHKIYQGGKDCYYAALPDNKIISDDNIEYQLHQWREEIGGGERCGYRMTVEEVNELPSDVTLLEFDESYLEEVTARGEEDRVTYLNLTNGLEALQGMKLRDVKFVRIQSTKCEQKDWSFIIEDLDYQFLFDLALGRKVVVIDFSVKKEKTRAIYQGLPWIIYVLNRRWFDREITSFVKQNNVTKYFRSIYHILPERTKKKLDYVKKFLSTDKIYLYGACEKTKLDSKYEVYKDILYNKYLDMRSEDE